MSKTEKPVRRVTSGELIGPKNDTGNGVWDWDVMTTARFDEVMTEGFLPNVNGQSGNGIKRFDRVQILAEKNAQVVTIADAIVLRASAGRRNWIRRQRKPSATQTSSRVRRSMA